MNEQLSYSLDELVNNVTGLFFWQEEYIDQKKETFYSVNVINLTGYSGSEIINFDRGWQSVILKDDLSDYRRKLDEFENDTNSEELKIEYRIVCKNRKIINVSERIRKLRNSNGNANKKIGVVTDITEYTSEIRQLANKLDELKQLNSSKDSFISILSHDLRAPFTSILGFSDILMQETSLSDKEKNEYLKYINESSQNQLQLINYLLDWSRLQTGRLKIDPQRIHAQSVVYNCVSALTGMAVRKNVSIKVDIPDTLFIDVDERLISQVLTNLISNAVKYSKEFDTVDITAGVFNDRMCEFIVKDEGSGISDTNRDKLFNIGRIFSTEGTKGEKGTGLGLALAKQIIEKHDGEIWFYSSEGTGSEFHFTVPVSENSILLVLENEDELNNFSQVISKQIGSYKLLTARNGFEALGIISSRMPSLIIADHNLPLMGGIQFVQTVRKENKNLRMPVIMLIDSEEEDNDEITNSYQEIGVKTLKKIPVNQAQLKEKIESLLFSD